MPIISKIFIQTLQKSRFKPGPDPAHWQEQIRNHASNKITNGPIMSNPFPIPGKAPSWKHN